MKYLVAIAVVLGLALLPASYLPTQAQAPTWQAAVAAGNPATAASLSSVNAMVADAAGNVYVTGTFSGTMSLGGINLTSAGGNDVFVARWSPVSGAFVWAQRAGGTGDDLAQALAVSGTSVYVAGAFTGTATFGASSLTSFGNYEGFVAKLTDAGSSASFGWALRMGGAGLDETFAVAATGTSVYVSGFFDLTAAFGLLSLTTAGGNDIFVAKLTDAGATASFVWARRAGGTGLDQPAALAVSGSSVYVTGGFASTTATFGTTTLSSTGNGNSFVAKLTDAGTTGDFTWVRQGAGTSFNNINALAVSGTTLYLGGTFTGTVGLGSIVLSSAGGFDGFVARLTDAGATGDFVWGQGLGGTGTDIVQAMSASGTNVYAAGVFSGTSAFGSASLTSAGSNDLFVTKLTDAGTTGSFTWAQRAGGIGSDLANALALTSSGTLCAGGAAAPPAPFGSLTVASPFSSQLGFVASLAGNVLATASAGPLAGLALYPTPSHGRATVQIPAGSGPATLTVLDALGRTLRTQPAATSSTAELDLAGLTPGLYAVRMAIGTSTATQRLVVE